MDSANLARLRQRARWAYELARLRRASIGIAPLLPVVGIAACIARSPGPPLWLGVATIAAGVAMFWYGLDPQRAVVPGIAAGLAPLVLALCATHVHVCGADGCYSLCMPACVVGGVAAGFAVAFMANQRQAGARFLLSASTLALLTGAIGCACLGVSGVVGLTLGFVTGMSTGLLSRGASRG